VEVLARRTALYRANQRGGAENRWWPTSPVLVVLARSGTGSVRRGPLPGGGHRRGLPATLVVNKSDSASTTRLPPSSRVPRAVTHHHLLGRYRPGSEELRAALTPVSWPPGRTIRSRRSPRSCCASCRRRRSRSANWCARRKDVTRPPPRAVRSAKRAALIDSPGVRDFAPAAAALDERTLGFLEVMSVWLPGAVSPIAATCASRCRCARPPRAVPCMSRRYESYRRLRRLREDLSAARRPQRRR